MSFIRQTAPVLPTPAAGTFRQVVESFVLLAVAVVLFRGFAAEGFMISTGSMAPTLLGYHRRVVCPDCGFEFARGASEEASDTEAIAREKYEIGFEEPTDIRCPNCSLTAIPFSTLPRTEGDQLLVHKHAYEFREPRRWEVIVFRNPAEPREAYVKRVAGLPGEQIEIRGGEVFANGVLCRKPLDVQRAIKVPFARFVNRISGADPDVQSGWQTTESPSRWSISSKNPTFDGLAGPTQIETQWLTYRHWIRAGGRHSSSVPLAKWPVKLSVPEGEFSSIQFAEGRLSCVGVLSDLERRTWLARCDEPEFQLAINQLFEQSHLAPLVDESGYNAVDEIGEHIVDEFFTSFTLHQVSGQGRIEIRLRDSTNTFAAVLDFGSRECRLLRNDDPIPVRQGPWKPDLTTDQIQVEFSLFDNQATLAINGITALEPFPYDAEGEPLPVRMPLQLGAANLSFQVTDLTLARDVYYVSKAEQDAPAVQLGPDEFFVLGDNSPVSVDSRVWAEPAVPRRALIGKPLVVHLPSNSRRLQWNGQNHDVRVPDFSRARVVR